MPAACRPVARLAQDEPVKAVRRQSQQVGQLTDRRKQRTGVELDGDTPGKWRQIELHRLRTTRDIGDAENGLARVFAQIRQNLAIFRIEERKRAASQRRMPAPHGEHPPRPVEDGMRITGLRLDVDGAVAVERIHDRPREKYFRRRPARTAAP